jgi:hypothetical protein
MFGLFRKKQPKCKRFYDLESSTFDLQGLNASVPGKFSFGTGSLKIDKQRYKNISEKLLMHDSQQFELCQQINSIHDPALQDQVRIKRIDLLNEINRMLAGLNENAPAPAKQVSRAEAYFTWLAIGREIRMYDVSMTIPVPTPDVQAIIATQKQQLAHLAKSIGIVLANAEEEDLYQHYFSQARLLEEFFAYLGYQLTTYMFANLSYARPGKKKHYKPSPNQPAK